MIDENLVVTITKKILNEINLKEAGEKKEKDNPDLGIFDDVDKAVECAKEAQKKFALMDLEKREEIIAAIREACVNNARLLAEIACSETGRGRVEDKVAKNILAVKKTPGTEDLKPTAWTGDRGLTLVEMAPVGVIASITPVTNPTATIINNTISMLAAGNAVVFNPHPNAKKCSNKAVEIINEAILKVGAPKGLVCSINNPTIQTAQKLMEHPEVNMVVVTGGKAVVETALRSGKKVIGAGAGNPPVVVDETADIVKAAHDIACGASFDNNLPCIAEKEIIAVERIADMLLERMKREGAYVLHGKDIDRMTELIFQGGLINKDLIGKDAHFILSQIGIETGKDIRLVVMPVDVSHPLVYHEQLMPVIPFVTVPTVEEAINLAVKAEGGNRHTAVMHSKNVENMTAFARAIQTTIFVKNAPSYAGIGFGGEGYTTFTIAGPTGEGLTSARTFTRQRRCVLVDAFRIV